MSDSAPAYYHFHRKLSLSLSLSLFVLTISPLSRKDPEETERERENFIRTSDRWSPRGLCALGTRSNFLRQSFWSLLVWKFSPTKWSFSYVRKKFQFLVLFLSFPLRVFVLGSLFCPFLFIEFDYTYGRWGMDTYSIVIMFDLKKLSERFHVQFSREWHFSRHQFRRIAVDI